MDDVIKVKINSFQERINFLKQWNSHLKELGDFESLNKVYINSQEIGAKEHFITTYQEDIAMREASLEEKNKIIDSNFSEKIADLKKIHLADNRHNLMKQSILNRYKLRNWKSAYDKIKDYNDTVALLTSYANSLHDAIQQREKAIRSV